MCIFKKNTIKIIQYICINRLTKLMPKFTKLLECSQKNTSYFSLKDRVYICKCVKVYDGDTITVVFKPFENCEFYKFSVRLSGIDTPEIRTNNEDEKKKAILVRDYLRELILDKLIIIKCGDFDKYGRLLAYIYLYNQKTPQEEINDIEKSINHLLISKNYAYLYDGGTKREFS